MKNVILSRVKLVSMIGLVAVVVVLVGGIDLSFAQPPTLPSAPSQAPIDGGLSILALSAGVYGLRKLRNKQSN